MCSANIWLIRTLCKQFTRCFYVCSHAGVREVRVQELNITRHLCGRVRVCLHVCACMRAAEKQSISPYICGEGERMWRKMEQMCPADYCSVFVLM